jgi:hypothetical protein
MSTRYGYWCVQCKERSVLSANSEKDVEHCWMHRYKFVVLYRLLDDMTTVGLLAYIDFKVDFDFADITAATEIEENYEENALEFLGKHAGQGHMVAPCDEYGFEYFYHAKTPYQDACWRKMDFVRLW